jgi:diguanylate cyclase (GGDEF)-like protein
MGKELRAFGLPSAPSDKIALTFNPSRPGGHGVFQNLNLDLSDFLLAEIAVVHPTGAIVHCNRKWEDTARIGLLLPKQSGWNYIAECQAAIDRACGEAATILAGLRAVLEGDLSYFVGTYACPFSGLHHWYQVQISAFEFNEELHAVLMHVDVSALQRDPLTGVANRAMFDAQLNLVLSLARDTGPRTGVIIVDLDRLKFNDMHGHRVGDEALIALASKLQKSVGPNCVVARIGGDEFGVVLPANCDVLSAHRLRANFKSGIECSIGAAGKPIFVSASVGVAVCPEDGTTASELLASADKSMYAQKRGISVA